MQICSDVIAINQDFLGIQGKRLELYRNIEVIFFGFLEFSSRFRKSSSSFGRFRKSSSSFGRFRKLSMSFRQVLEVFVKFRKISGVFDQFASSFC